MDVMGAFIRGHQAGQAEQEHAAAMEQNKLHTMILRHQIDGLKVEDELRKRAIEQQNIQLMQGQPDASMPTEDVQQPRQLPENLPTAPIQDLGLPTSNPMSGLTDVVSSMVRNNLVPPTQAPKPMPASSGINLGRTTTKRRASMPISGVPSLGISGVSVMPKSAEDLVRQSIAGKLAEPYTLGPDQTRFVGGQEVAHGKPKAASSWIAVDQAAAKGDPLALETIRIRDASRRAPASAWQHVMLDGEPAWVWQDPTTHKLTDLSGEVIDSAADRVQPMPTSQGRSGSGAGGETPAQVRLAYDEFVKRYEETYPVSTVATMTGTAKRRIPANTSPDKVESIKDLPPPPSFDKWQVMLPDERQRMLSDPNARITDAELGRRRSKVPSNQPSSFGTRADGSEKGNGFFGVLKRPDGNVSSELSMGTTDITGKETEIPLLVPTLTKQEVTYLLSAPPSADWKNPTMQGITRKAIDFARSRQKQGKPFFATSDEARTDLYPDLPRAPGVSAAAGKSGAVPPGLVPGAVVTLKNGQKVTVKKVSPDGTFEY